MPPMRFLLPGLLCAIRSRQVTVPKTRARARGIERRASHNVDTRTPEHIQTHQKRRCQLRKTHLKSEGMQWADLYPHAIGVWRRTRDDGLTARTVLVVDFVVASTRRGKHSPSRESEHTRTLSVTTVRARDRPRHTDGASSTPQQQTTRRRRTGEHARQRGRHTQSLLRKPHRHRQRLIAY